MSSNPIKLIHGNVTKPTQATKPIGSQVDPNLLSNGFSSAPRTPSAAFKVAQSLSDLLAGNPTSVAASASSYTAQGLKTAFPKLQQAETTPSESPSTSKSKGLASIRPQLVRSMVFARPATPSSSHNSESSDRTNRFSTQPNRYFSPSQELAQLGWAQKNSIKS